MAQIEIDLGGLPEAMNAAYYPLLSDQARIMALKGGAGAGKSVFAAQKLLVRAVSEMNRQGRPHRFLVLRKVARTVRQSCWRLLGDTITGWGWDGLVASRNRQEMTLAMANGAEFIFGGLDDREKIKSIQGITGVWMEEATEFDEEDLEQLLLRVRGEVPGYKQFILTFNPISATHWLKRRLWDRPDPRRATLLTTTHRDNRWLSQADHDDIEALRETNPSLYRVYGDGDWGVLVGLIYSPADVVAAAEWPEPWRFGDQWYGLDFGYNNPAAIVHHGMIDGELWESEVLYERSLTTGDLSTSMAEANMDRSLNLWCDSARPEAIEELRRAGWRAMACPKGPDSVMSGIGLVQSLRLRIHEAAVNVIKEHGAYAWELDSGGKPTDQPVKHNDHAMDARRYGVWGQLGKRTVSGAAAAALGGSRIIGGRASW